MRPRLKINHPTITLEELRERERQEKDGQVKVRLQTIRLVWEEQHTNLQIASLLQIKRNRIPEWVSRFNEKGFEGLQNAIIPGRPQKLTSEQREQVRLWVQTGPDLEKDGFPTYNGPRLTIRIQQTFGVEYHESSVNRLLHRLGACRGKTRKIPAKADPQELEDWKKKTAKDKEDAEAEGRKVRFFFEDEAIFSLTTEMGYVWYFPGFRPELKCFLSRTYRYVIGAAEPESGEFFSILMPWLNTDTYQIFLEEFAKEYKEQLDAGIEFWLAVDRAGWHTSKGLTVPAGIKLIEMPTGAAQINPIERLWLYIRDHWTRCRIWKDVDELEEVLCALLLVLMQSPQLVSSVCSASFLKKAA
jgi:transposase